MLGAIFVLFWNEGRAVKTATALNEGAGLVRTIDPASPPADAAGKLVHFSGALEPSGVPEDKLFAGIAAPAGTIRLERQVEMYQWHESKTTRTTKTVGGSEETVTTYSYSRKWSDRAIDSSRFRRPEGHQNPGMAASSQTFGVASGSVGRITLAGSQFSYLGTDIVIPPDNRILSIIKRRFGGRQVVASGDAVLIRAIAGADTVGDLRIRFASADVDTISVVGKLDGGRIGAFTASNGRKISMFEAGTMDAKQMFDDALATNSMWTWLIRLGGFIAMFIGFKLIFRVVGVAGDIIPIIGDMFRFATGMAALALSAVISTAVIGVAWIYYRPLVGIGIMLVGTIIAGAALKYGKGQARARQAEA
ncbi:MAG: TMEM43 family protein [Pseudomonadota bacterium]